MLTLFLALCLVVSLFVPASAAENSQVSTSLENLQVQSVDIAFKNNVVENFGSVSVKDAVVINGVTNYLYPTFDDVNASLSKLKSEIPEYYHLVDAKVDLAKTYTLPYTEQYSTDFQINVDQAVKETLRTQVNSSSVPAQGTTQLQDLKAATAEKLELQQIKFDAFLDIYENKAQNDEIKAYLASTSTPDPEVLAYMLPYNSPFSSAFFESSSVSATTAQTFIKEKGTEYAIKWATSRNKNSYPDYSSKGGDCANFASQIMVAGGIKMHYATLTSSGWYCKRVGTVNPGTGFVSSESWRRADKFVRFMGTSGNTCKDFKKFSAKILAGDFIAFDETNDGEWDHVGYVTEKGRYGTYPYLDYDGSTKQKSYTNFCVAQHSKDYYAWINSRINAWELLDNGVNVYAIVRRNYSITF